MKKLSIAVVGAGFAGIILARNLAKIADVKVFDKARGPSGRMSSRSYENFTFDFGAQFFIAKTPEFKNFLQPFIDKEVLEQWCGNFAEIDDYKITYQREWLKEKNHYVPVPKMNQLCKELAQYLDIKFQTQVKKICSKNNKWQIFDNNDNNLGEFDWVFFAIPPMQLLDLAPINCGFYEKIKETKMLGCFALMLGLDRNLKLPFNMALVKNSIISWITSEASKPKRSSSPSYTILARNSWADHNMEDDIESVKLQLTQEFKKIISVFDKEEFNIVHNDVHRWRYANIGKQEHKNSHFIDVNNNVGACGDWFIHGRVEASYLSAMRLYENFIKSINQL